MLLSVGKEPTLTKTMVRLEDAGTYRCELANMKTSRAGVTHFHVRGQCWGVDRSVRFRVLGLGGVGFRARACGA